jgi:hypothetical protein
VQPGLTAGLEALLQVVDAVASGRQPHDGHPTCSAAALDNVEEAVEEALPLVSEREEVELVEDEDDGLLGVCLGVIGSTDGGVGFEDGDESA